MTPAILRWRFAFNLSMHLQVLLRYLGGRRKRCPERVWWYRGPFREAARRRPILR